MFRLWALPILLVATVLIAACGSATRAGVDTRYHVSVQSGGKTLKSFDLTALRALPAVDVATPQSGGKKVQRGPLVQTVLARAGVHQFNRLLVVGQGASQSFTSAEINDQVVLNFDNRGTVKLADAEAPQSRWVPAVTALDIE